MSAVPLQATINKWVNLEAINEYAAKLHRWAQDEEWRDRPDLAASLRDAAVGIETAAKVAVQATNAATNAAYDRIYPPKVTA